MDFTTKSEAIRCTTNFQVCAPAMCHQTRAATRNS